MRWLILVVCVAGCGKKTNAKYCDTTTTCADPSMMCDAVAHQCVPATADLGMPDLAGSSDDLAVSSDLATGDLLNVDLTPPPACTISTNCPANLPVCDSAALTCRACSGAGDDPVCVGHSQATPHCKLAGTNAGQCAACNVSADCSSGAKPVCDADGTCRKCKLHSECTSGICKDDGSCADGDNEILYVNNANGGCTGTFASHAGTKADPVCNLPGTTIAIGMDLKNKLYVFFTGSGTSYSGFTISPSAGNSPNGYVLTLVGDSSGAAPKIVGAAQGINLIESSGVTAAVTVDGLSISGKSGGGAQPGIQCGKSNGTLTVNVRQSKIISSGNEGIISSACGVTISDSTISGNGATGIKATTSTSMTVLRSTVTGNQGAGIAADGGSLVVDASIISANKNAGIDMSTGPAYTITNNFIFDNAQGVSFSTFATQGVFQFNTVAKNSPAVTNAEDGIDCGTVGPNRQIEASIVWGNGTNNGHQFAGTCVFVEVVTGDADGISATPAFLASTKPYDFHLAQSDTSSIDQISGTLDGGTPLADHDIDGEMRPKGTKYDVGADEAK